VFVALLGWLLAETRDGSVLGLAERLTSSIQTCWPFIVAVALRRTRRPVPARAPAAAAGRRAGPPHGPAPAAAGDRLLAHTGRRLDDDVTVLLFEAASPPARPQDQPAAAPAPAGDTPPGGDPPAAAAPGFLGRPAARKRSRSGRPT